MYVLYYCLNAYIFVYRIIEEDYHSLFLLSSSFNGFLQSLPTNNRYNSIFYFTKDSLIAVDAKNGLILQRFHIASHHCIIKDTTGDNNTILSLEKIEDDGVSLQQCGERLLHCSLTGAIGTTADTERGCGYEIVINVEKVTTFVSLFERMRKRLKNFNEFFVVT